MAQHDLILAGDIGGTKTHLALFSQQGERLEATITKDLSQQRIFRARTGPKRISRRLSGCHRPGLFRYRRPVVDGQVRTPNLPWVVNAAKLADTCKLRSVALLNDLEAAAYGIFTLQPQELLSLNEGTRRRPGNKVLIAAGTGLGEATLYDDGRDYHPAASEGGHADFAPRDETEIDLLRYLIKKFGRVSYERVVSGPGLANIYEFLRDGGRMEEPEWLKEKIAAAGGHQRCDCAGGIGRKLRDLRQGVGSSCFSLRRRSGQSGSQRQSHRRSLYRRRHRAENRRQDRRRHVHARFP